MLLHLTKGNLVFNIILDVAIIAIGVALISIFYLNTPLLTGLLVVLIAVGMIAWYEPHDIYFFIIAALVGPIVEATCVHFGVWTYTNPTFFGIPIWLSIVWGMLVVAIKRLAQIFVTIESKGKA